MTREYQLASSQHQFRILLLGDADVGKTSLLQRYIEGDFGADPPPSSTVGVEFYSQMLQLASGPRIKLQFWDTAGDERYRSITRSFYRNTVGVLLVFDVTNRKSFNHVEDWYQEVASVQGSDKVVFLLVGHKCDLQQARQVSTQEAETLAAVWGMSFLETSAKTNSNVTLAFETLVHEIQQSLQRGEIKVDGSWGGVRVIHRAQPPLNPRRKKPSGQCQC
ncbi:ras-related protein Rab-42 [Monodelphis domestica]|uniref:ras-related protein Rab-42 n=1 Tax=Monodelphis domestica TaxID=13616 RepID=UPI0024E1D705|nr:ras-related protein Rab-42 [Monodelphis domestica]